MITILACGWVQSAVVINFVIKIKITPSPIYKSLSSPQS